MKVKTPFCWPAFRCLRTCKQVKILFSQIWHFFLVSVQEQYDSAFLILSPPAKALSCDVIMHAFQIWGQGRSYLPDQRVSYLWLKKRGKERGISASATDEIWTCKAYFVLPVVKRKVLRIQPFTFISLYLSAIQICIYPCIFRRLSLVLCLSICYFTTIVFFYSQHF